MVSGRKGSPRTMESAGAGLIFWGDRTNAVTSWPRVRARSTISVPVRPVAPSTKSLMLV